MLRDLPPSLEDFSVYNYALVLQENELVSLYNLKALRVK